MIIALLSSMALTHRPLKIHEGLVYEVNNSEGLAEIF